MTTDTKALAELILRHQARPSDDPYFWSPTKTEVRLSEAYLALLEENKRLREALSAIRALPRDYTSPEVFDRECTRIIDEALANHAQESDENKTADWRNDVDSYEPSATPKPEGE